MNKLDSLRKKYATKELNGLFELKSIYSLRSSKGNRNLIDTIVTSSSLSMDIFFQPAPDPLAVKAIEITAPSFDFNSLQLYSDAEMMGVVNSAKGKYFELLVEEKLNAGENIGNIVLSSGETASLAESSTQPGWDLMITDANGNISEYMQLKATDSLSYIYDTLEKYPEYQILATSEVSEQIDKVYNSGISNEAITETIANTANTSFIEALPSPLIPIAWILLNEGYHYSKGRTSISQVEDNISDRGSRFAASYSAGSLAILFDGGMFSILASIAGGIIYDELSDTDVIDPNIERNNLRLKLLRDKIIN